MSRLFIGFFLCLGVFLLYQPSVFGQDLWAGVHGTTGFDPNSVSQIDANTAASVGAGGLMLKTIDGGTTWWAYPSGVSVDLNAVYFHDANLGWAVGASTSPGGSVFLSTTNGGTSWTRQAAPASFSPTLNGVYFQSPTLGWAVGTSGRAARTTNGGTVWLSITMPAAATFALYSVHFRDANNGYIVGGSTNTGYVMKTTDGGITWTDPVQVSSQALYAVENVDATTAVAVGNNGAIVQTTDNGANWNTQSTPGGAFRPLRDLSVAGTTVFAAGYTVVIVSTNGGTNWTRKNTGLQGNAVYPPQALNSIAMADANAGWAVGSGGVLYKTMNGGTSWSYQLPGST